MPHHDPNMLLQQSEPFLASLYDDSAGQGFVKPREKCMQDQLKSTYMQGPMYQNMPLYIPPPDYSIPAPISPTPSPSPYTDHDNDPLSGLKKFHGPGYVTTDQYSMYDANKPNEISKMLQKDIALTQTLQVDDGFNLNMAQIEDQNLASLDYMTPTPEAGVQYRSPSDYYTLNDVANLCGIPSDNSSLYPPQQANNTVMYPSYDNYSMQYPNNTLVDMSDKKISPIEQAYQASWGQNADPNLFDKISPYGLAEKDDYNLAAFSLSDQQILPDAQNTQLRGGFPAMDIQPETTIPNLRGRKNSSFREWNPTTDNINKDSRVPLAMANQLQDQFVDQQKVVTQIELLNEGAQILAPPEYIQPNQPMVPEYHNLTPLTAGPSLPPNLDHTQSSDPQTLDKVRSVFMSFVDNSEEKMNCMNEVAKHQMFVDVCNMYKSLSAINIAENIGQNKKEGEDGNMMNGNDVDLPENGDTRANGKRYKFRLSTFPWTCYML